MKLLVCSLLSLLGTASLAPGAIVLLDASFEDTNVPNGGFQQNAYSTGWTGGTGTASTFLVDNGAAQNTYFGEAVPDGQQAMSLAGGFITQQLNDNVTGAVMTATVAQQFDITFFAARRSGGSGGGTGHFTILLQAYNGNTYVGDLASQKFYVGANDSNTSTIDLGLGAGEWSDQINLSLTAPANLHAGNNIRLVFAANGSFGTGTGNLESAIDDVAVTLIPEPSIALLGGLGLLGLLRRRR
jgi:hypothetical protein